MSSPVEIANLALSWLGQDQINALSDDQNEAIIMNANYVLSRDKTLSDVAWTFALRRETLAPVADKSAFGPENRFLIPSDVLRVHRVYRANASIQSAEFQNARWTRVGEYIFAIEESVWAVFIVQVVDPKLFSPQFSHALAARLAADTCITFTENARLEETMEARYESKLADAAYADGSQGRTEVVRSTKLTGARTR